MMIFTKDLIVVLILIFSLFCKIGRLILKSNCFGLHQIVGLKHGDFKRIFLKFHQY